MPRCVLTFLALLSVALTASAAGRDTTTLLARAQSLAWAKQFDEAARLYREVLRDAPSSRDARLGLARVRLWQGRYPESREMFLKLVARNRADTDAAEGAATAAYWSGDYRTALREFTAIANAHPHRHSVRRMLNDLRSASATTTSFETAIIDDDQPFRSTRSQARVSMFTDPLTRWDASAGGYTLDSTSGGRHSAPFIAVRNETVIPSLRLTVTPSIGAIRLPDGTHAIGGATVAFRVAPHDSLAMSFTRHEILSNATKLYPFVNVTSISWRRTGPWLGSAEAERDRFSDHNAAIAADAYALFPIATRAGWSWFAGGSALTRDTRDSRFYVSGITATRDPSGAFFHYTYRGAYDPYWTPQHLFEARAIVAIERRFGSKATLRAQGDGGQAHDRAVSFWPDSGRTPFPSSIGQSTFNRSYSPWRLDVTSSMPIAHGITLDVGWEHSVTSFYRANRFHASLARRR
ncbi:MAG TPA: tetratricopeptide repeat protein [Thermoanaerobaculia bacterium]